MTAVTIPPELAADVAARPEAYRPLVPRQTVVFALAGDAVGHVGPVRYSDPPDAVTGCMPWVAIDIGSGQNHPATAWALVGSVDGGPRPEVRQRVLVLATPDPHDQGSIGSVGHVVDVPELGGGRVAVRVPRGSEWDPEAPCYATRWALLPAAEPDDLAGDNVHGWGATTGYEGDAVQVQGGADAVIRDCRIAVPRPGIPPGDWRQGGHAKRNLWIGGAYPEGVDVGRMDTPELAAYVVEAANAHREELATSAGEVTDAMVERAVAAFMGGIVGPIISDTSGMHDAIRDALEAAPVQWRPLSVRENERLKAEVERLRAALQRISDLDGVQRIVAPDIASGALAGGS
jgi:hypothetical protein